MRGPHIQQRSPRRRTWVGWLDAAAQRQVALHHGICPYYLGQELVRWADVLVGDVNYLFDGNGLLWGLTQALDWKLAVLVDEAHNLVERARRMYSAELRISQIRAAAQTAPGAVRGTLDALVQASEDLVLDSAAPYEVLEGAPDPFVQALQTAAGATSEYFNQHPLNVGSLQRVVQAAGRVLRTPQDRGWLWLLDDRYARAEVIELLPPWWQRAEDR